MNVYKWQLEKDNLIELSLAFIGFGLLYQYCVLFAHLHWYCITFMYRDT